MKRDAVRRIAVAAGLIFLAGCAKMPDQRLFEKARKLETKQKFQEAIAQYERLVKQYPHSPHVVDAHYARANAYAALQDFPKAVEAFTELTKTFPDTVRLVANAHFMIGYIYHNEMKDTANARMAYRAFIDRFPNNELASSAQWELDHLGVDINQDPLFKK